MKIIKQREYHEGPIVRERFFEWENTPGAGAAFECDEDGNVDEAKLADRPAALENYRQCIAGTRRSNSGEKIIDRGVREYQLKGYMEPAVGLCDCCGAEVSLGRFTNTCDCGADYNGSGDLLAPRSQWGEETGESVSDILAVDSHSDSDTDW